jgi:hypothetical protein
VKGTSFISVSAKDTLCEGQLKLTPCQNISGVRWFSVSPTGFLAKILAFFIWSYSGVVKFDSPLVTSSLKVLPFMISYKRQRSMSPTPK